MIDQTIPRASILFSATGCDRALVLAAAVLIVGCSSGPAAVRPPEIDPDSAGELAMVQYDKDVDGYVSGDELEHAPGLKAALKNLDTNADGKVTAEEVAQRVRVWQGTGTGLTSISCEVRLDGRPLEGAEITFEPEEFLGEEIQPAVATLSVHGSGSPKIPKEKRPSADSPPGLHLGLYRVKISKTVGGKEIIPARYNVETTLGQEVSPDDERFRNNRVVFSLSSK